MARSPAREGPDWIQWFAVLGDVTRLRIMRLIEAEELGVGELARIVQIPQSTVSRHLKLLTDQNWAAKRQAGTSSLYRLTPGELEDDARVLWTTARNRLTDSTPVRDDDARLDAVLAQRDTDSRAYFGQLGGEWDEKRRELFGERFTTDALLALLPEDSIVADIGCGTGEAAERIAPYVERIIAIDRERSMLDAARKRLARFHHIEFRTGEIDTLPLADGEVDMAVVSLVMHHIEDPPKAVERIARALRPGGVLLVIDMVAHDRDAYRHTMGHRHLGFSDATIAKWAKAAGLERPRVTNLEPDANGAGPGLFVATMRKPDAS